MRTFAGSLAAFAVTAVAGSAAAGDTASLSVLGYSPDGKVFAFEEYGIFDGSGFPYSNIYFIDTYRRMLTPAGKPDETLFVEDRLHLNSKGYAIWKQEVAKFLRRFPSRHFGALGEPWFSDRNAIWP